MLLKDARILFNEEKCPVDNTYKITEIIVEEFSKEHNPQYLYKKYSSDFGNCDFWRWDKIKPLEVVIMLMVGEKFMSEDIANKAWKELHKIDEVKEALIELRQKNDFGRFVEQES